VRVGDHSRTGLVESRLVIWIWIGHHSRRVILWSRFGLVPIGCQSESDLQQACNRDPALTAQNCS
jgi:hypothetical protein